MGAFFPSNPQDPVRTRIERDAWLSDQKKQTEKEQQETRRFVITCVISGIAALAAVAGVIIQLVKG